MSIQNIDKNNELDQLNTDGNKLRFLARYFDEMYPDNPDTEVQNDLRRIADKLDKIACSAYR